MDIQLKQIILHFIKINHLRLNFYTKQLLFFKVNDLNLGSLCNFFFQESIYIRKKWHVCLFNIFKDKIISITSDYLKEKHLYKEYLLELKKDGVKCKNIKQVIIYFFEKNFYDICSVINIIHTSLFWVNTTKGFDFWQKNHFELRGKLYSLKFS